MWTPVMCEDTFSRASGGHQWTWTFYDANEKPRSVRQYRVVNDTVGGVGLTHDYWYDALGRRVLARTYSDTTSCGNPPTTSPWPEACQQSLTRTAWDGDFLLWESRRQAAWNLSPASLDALPANDAWYGQRRNMHAGAIDVPLVVWSGTGVGLAILRNWRGNAAGANQFHGTALGYEPVWPAAQVDVRHAPDARTSPPPGNSWWGSLVSDQTDATGLLYRRNRYYDPQTGRFTQPDPIGLAGGLNLYGYAGGDPINFSDPFGLCPKSAGGDGKTEEMSDCPRGSSGWWAYRDAQGEGSSLVNNAMGLWATFNNDVRARLPENTAIAEFNVPIGPRAGAVRAMQRQLTTAGRGSVESTVRTLTGRIAEHEKLIEQYRAAGGNVSSMEREIRAWRETIAAAQQVLGNP